MLTNATITIFNKFPDRENRRFVYVPHVLKDVWFHTDQKTAVADAGLVSADSYRIRIPHPCVGWVSENYYVNQGSPDGIWTVQNGDFFLVGEWDDGNVSGIKDIQDRFHGIVGTVLSHSEIFFGTAPHIRIGGGS